MSELKFTGTATLTGFPRDKSFNFELDGPDRLVVKAGKEIFLIIEKEPAAVVETRHLPITVNVPAQELAPEPVAFPHRTAPPQGVAETGEEASGEAGGRKRGPNVKIDEALIIKVDPNLANPYSKLRGKYYETLKTANGRPVSWWKETSMVKSLEGNPVSMLKFFLSEKVIGLVSPEMTQGAQQTVAAPILPGGFTQGQMQSPQIPGSLWTPPGATQPGQSGSPGFLG